MKIGHCFVLFIFISTTYVVRSEVLTAGVVAVASAVTAGFVAVFNKVNCIVSECCTDRWISPNFTDLQLTLDKKLYGQHLVIDSVVKHLKGHVTRHNPSKALALSFHGGTGTGKNHVSRIVAKAMFRNGMKSKYVHLISATKEFPHSEMLSFYKDKLRDMIEKAAKSCGRSLMIIDEMDKMPQGLIDTLKPYLDYYDELGGVDYRRMIFFFLSNTGAKDITQKTVEYWNGNLPRTAIRLKEMEDIIRLPALNMKNSGLWHSELITKNLISAFVPFLPLERTHVSQCIKEGLLEAGYYRRKSEIPEDKVQEVADELSYGPEGINVFSTTGCKRILEKIDYVMG